jgi:hypothetical protein
MREAIKNVVERATSPATNYLRYFAKDSPAVRLAALSIFELCRLVGRVLQPLGIVLLVWALKQFL